MTFSIPRIGKSLALAVLGGSMTITAGAFILGLGSSAAGAHSLLPEGAFVPMQITMLATDL